MRMKNLLIFGILALNGLVGSGSSYAEVKDWSARGWEFLQDKDGIKSFRKSYPNSPVKGVGGEAEVDAPIGKILWVLMDHDHKNQWIDKFKSARTLEELTPTSNVQVASFDMPFPVSDREFVFTMNFRVDKILNAVIVELNSLPAGKGPSLTDGDIRGEVQGRYVLYPRGDKTFVQAEYLADAKGSLPVFIVNMVQKSWPHMTFETLRIQVKKDFVKSWEPYEALLKPRLNEAPARG